MQPFAKRRKESPWGRWKVGVRKDMEKRGFGVDGQNSCCGWKDVVR